MYQWRYAAYVFLPHSVNTAFSQWYTFCHHLLKRSALLGNVGMLHINYLHIHVCMLKVPCNKFPWMLVIYQELDGCFSQSFKINVTSVSAWGCCTHQKVSAYIWSANKPYQLNVFLWILHSKMLTHPLRAVYGGLFSFLSMKWRQ